MKVLCFAPYDGVWRFNFPQALFLNALSQSGDEIYYLYCDRGIKNYCMTMAASGISIDDDSDSKNAICNLCCRRSKQIRDNFNFKSISLSSFINHEDNEFANNLLLRNTEDLQDFHFNDIPIGKIAAYEALIHSKHIDLKINGQAENIYRAIFHNCYLIAAASLRVLKNYNIDVGVTYHSAYSYNRVFHEILESKHLSVFSLNTSYNVAEHDSHLVVTKDNPYQSYRRQIEDWPLYKDISCSEEEFHLAARHLTSLMSGLGLAFLVPLNSSSSTNNDYISLNPEKKLILVTLSSYDELLATEVAGFGLSRDNLVFSSQIEWVKWLFDYAKSRDDIQIIIRVHPREFPFNRNGKRSAHSYQLEMIFGTKPPNVFINLPSDRISIYELMLKADVVLVAWSSAGLEASMLGIPVVTYCEKVLLYPSSLIVAANTKYEYRVAVDAALTESWSIDKALISFRWAVFFFVKSRVSINNIDYLGWRGSDLWNYINRRLQYIRRRIFNISNEKWDLFCNQLQLKEKEKIIELVHKGLFSFYQIHDVHLAHSEKYELQALRSVLSSIAAHYQKHSGKPATRLLEMIKGTR